MDTLREYHLRVETKFVDGRLLLTRTTEEREPILLRLRRIEGQVRGLQQMLEQDRYCPEELQQANAVVAAMREVALVIAGQHLMAGIEHAQRSDDPTPVLEEIKSVLRSLVRQG